MQRDLATQKLEEVLARVTTGGFYADHVDQIFVFGSYARGASQPVDIDLDVEHRFSEALHQLNIKNMFAHRDETIDFRRELCGARRGFQIMFNKAESLRSEDGFHLVPIYERGDSFEQAIERLRSIREDPTAGTAPRDGVFAEVVGLEKRTTRHERELLQQAISKGVLSVTRLALSQEPPANETTKRRIDDTWGPRNVKRRAAYAAATYLDDFVDGPLLVGLPGRPPVRDKSLGHVAYFDLGSIENGIDALASGSRLCLCVFTPRKGDVALAAIAIGVRSNEGLRELLRVS